MIFQYWYNKLSCIWCLKAMDLLQRNSNGISWATTKKENEKAQGLAVPLQLLEAAEITWPTAASIFKASNANTWPLLLPSQVFLFGVLLCGSLWLHWAPVQDPADSSRKDAWGNKPVKSLLSEMHAITCRRGWDSRRL